LKDRNKQLDTKMETRKDLPYEHVFKPTDLWRRIRQLDWREFLLVLALCIQLIYLGITYIHTQVRNVWAMRGETAIERSEHSHFGTEDIAYLAFIREVVPADPELTVLLPYRGESGYFKYVTFMQYFFFPREVDNCSNPTEECLQYVHGATKYILGYPPREGVELGDKTYIPFDERRGIYVPMKAPRE
jgi:hypothetical protein